MNRFSRTHLDVSEKRKKLKGDENEHLKQVVTSFLSTQDDFLPVLQVKQSLEKEWIFSKESYNFKWKRFLESIEFIEIETRPQRKGNPIDYVRLNTQGIENDMKDNLQQIFNYQLPYRQRPKTLNEIVKSIPSDHILYGTLIQDSLSTTASTSGSDEPQKHVHIAVDTTGFAGNCKRYQSCFDRIISAFKRN